MRASLAPLRGLHGLARVSSQGTTLATQLALPEPETAPPQLLQLLGGLHDSFDAMSVPLPVEPVGVGARWRHVATLAPNALATTTTTTYEITAITGDLVQLATTVTQAASPSDPSLTLSATGTGTLELDLARVAPPRSTSSTTTHSTVRRDGESVTVDATVTVDVTSR